MRDVALRHCLRLRCAWAGYHFRSAVDSAAVCAARIFRASIPDAMANPIPSGFSRRSFLQYSAAGTAMLTLPQFLAACGGRASHGGGGPGSGPLPPAPPSNPFFGWFGIDEQTVRRVLAEL